jgi:hypothetical protein
LDFQPGRGGPVGTASSGGGDNILFYCGNCGNLPSNLSNCRHKLRQFCSYPMMSFIYINDCGGSYSVLMVLATCGCLAA